MSLKPPAPLAASITWDQVMAAAGGRCQCEGKCGRKHRPTRGVRPVIEGRCEATTDHDRLIAAPTEPTADPHRAAAGPLSAWCRPCYGDALKLTARVARATPAPAEPGLFDL